MSELNRPTQGTVRVGAYDLQMEQMGIRITRHRPRGVAVASPLLMFIMDEPVGTNNQPVRMHRLVSASSQEMALFHGYTRQQISLDGEIHPSEDGDGLRIVLSLLDTSEPLQARLTVRMNVPAAGEPWWLIPGVFYGDNRPGSSDLPRPSYSEVHRDPKRLISTRWAFRSDRAALPLVSLWNSGIHAAIHSPRTFGKDTGTYDPRRITGLGLGQDEGDPYLTACFPFAEAPVRFAFCEEPPDAPSGEYFMLEEGESLRLELDVRFGPPTRNAHVQPLRLAYDSVRVPVVPVAEGRHTEAARLAEEGMLRWHYDRTQGALYETSPLEWSGPNPLDTDRRRQMHSGWLSGALPAYVLLWSGREREDRDSVQAGTTVLNRITRQLAPCGTIFPLWSQDHGWSCSFGSEAEAAHSRTVAEAVTFILRALALESHFGAGHSVWLEAVVSSLNYAMGAQRQDGCLPTYYDLTTGAAISHEGVGGLPWIAAFTTAASLLQRGHYGEVAQRAGEYYAPFVRHGILFGSVEDQPGVPSCQDAVWAVIAYVNLYDWDRDIRWLKLATEAAEWLLSWQVGGKLPMPEATIMGRYGIVEQGAGIESVASPYLSSQILFCYRELCRLADYTDDPYYRSRLEDAVAFARQTVATCDGHFNGRKGMMPSQLYHVDWIRPKGSILDLSGVISMALLGYSDLVQRNLRLPDQARNWAALTREELAGQEVGRYAEEEIERLTGQRLTPSGPPAESPLGKLMGLATGEPAQPMGNRMPSEEESRTRIPVLRGDDLQPETPRRERTPPPAPRQREADVSGEATPLRQASQMTPIPYEDGLPKPNVEEEDEGDGAEAPPKRGTGDSPGEIKYKIF